MYTAAGKAVKAMSMGGKFTMPEGTTRLMHDVGRDCVLCAEASGANGRRSKRWSSRPHGLFRRSGLRNQSRSVTSRRLLEVAFR